MHDIWNPWHGCVKCSEGCQNCYMYFLDRFHGRNGSEIYRTKAGFNYPLHYNYIGIDSCYWGDIPTVDSVYLGI